jgi:hypothetical protein
VTSVEIVADWRETDPGVAADLIQRWAAEDPSSDFIRRAAFAVAGFILVPLRRRGIDPTTAAQALRQLLGDNDMLAVRLLLVDDCGAVPGCKSTV